MNAMVKIHPSYPESAALSSNIKYSIREQIIDYLACGGDKGEFFRKITIENINLFSLHKEFVAIYGTVIPFIEFYKVIQKIQVQEVENWTPLNINHKYLFYPKFSFYRAPISNKVPSEVLTLSDVYRLLTGEKYKKVTEVFRGMKETEQKKRYKSSNFDYITFSGIFFQRNINNLICPSKLLVIDFDHVSDIKRLRSILLSCKIETQLLFTSPSGNGLKWVISYDIHQWTHLQFFEAVQNYL